MDEAALTLLSSQPLWQRLLRHYDLATHEAVEPAVPGVATRGPRWATRISPPEDVPAQELTAAHGALIAHGWLLVQMEDGSAGLTYRVSSTGLAAMESALRDAEIISAAA